VIADFSGRALIRLDHAGSQAASRSQGRETAERVPLAGTPHGRALTGQTVEVETGADGARLFAPVTNRGEAIGVLELSPSEVPDEQTPADVALAAHAFRAQHLPPAPGDRLMFLTDGLLERNVAGVDIEALLAAGAQMHPREAVQHLLQAVLQAANGELSDDAAAMCLDWHGGPPRERTTESGANY
jgi:Stage II sporulation protein E (SpoIIE)